MSKLNALTNSAMTQNQIVDELTAHISLYHSNSVPSNQNQNQNQRLSIIKWFASLTVHQRQAHLTTVNFKFVQLLLQMLSKLYSEGYGRFIILPDIPSSRHHLHSLPSFCFKKSRGLLSRVAESNESERLIFESARIFNSKEGEKTEEEFCCSTSIQCLDSFTVSEELVGNVDKFVQSMDRISNGGFLRGEESELSCDWVELEWLKAKGYYSLEALVANRLELALRLAWLNCGNGKKRGVKLKEKVTAAGAAANVFLRKKGSVDWWLNLDADTKRNFFTSVLGKAAKCLTYEIMKGASSALEDDMWLFRSGAEQPLRYIYSDSLPQSSTRLPADAEFGSHVKHGSASQKAASLVNMFNCLFVVRDIVALVLPGQHEEYDASKIFFSTLSSVSSISDHILRKMRGLIMAISLDFMKLELLGEGNLKHLTHKQKENPSPGNRKKKGKMRNVKKTNPATETTANESSVNSPIEEINSMECNGTLGMPQGKEIQRDVLPSAVEMEHSKGLVLGNGRTAARKNRKGRNKKKNRNSTLNDSVDMRHSKKPVAEAPCLFVTSSNETAKNDEASKNSIIQNISNCDLANSVRLSGNIKFGGSGIEYSDERINSKSIEEGFLVGCNGGTCHLGSERKRSSSGLIEEETAPSRGVYVKVNDNVLSCAVDMHELDTCSSVEDNNFMNEEIKEKMNSYKPVNTFHAKEESSPIKGHGTRTSYEAKSTNPSEFFSYEWPSLAPVYFPSIPSQLLPAADRLHLDVGHNWHNHIRQPFVPTVHQTRNSGIKSGFNRTQSRTLPMSFDWPPMVGSISGLAPSLTCNYDSGFISRRQSAFHQSVNAHNMQFTAKTTDDERRYSGDFMDAPESANELMEDFENQWISEEELEMHAVSGFDYNQYFGGGVMYWNPSEHPGNGFSRPPSLSSDDSTWAFHEADMNRAVDDMVAFSSSYSTNGLTSPTAASFCSPFDPLGSGHQALGYVVSGNEVPGKVVQSSSPAADTGTEEEVTGSLANLSNDVEGKAGDSLSYPILPPIIIPTISREKSRSDFKRNHDHRSPCVPPSRREQPRLKRPPSPVVLCVPRAPRPPPPSPVSNSRKHRGFPTVRSGSSSPRHWSMRGLYHEGTSSEEACVRGDGTEVLLPSWRNRNLSAHPMIQPLSGSLLQDRLIAISQLARDQEHPDVSFPLQPAALQNCPTKKVSLSFMHSLLHDEIDFFCKQVAQENMDRKPFINWAVKRVTRSLQVLWPRSRTNIFGSNATGLSLPTSDVDLVVCLPPVRNLEPIKEAGILEGRNGIKETCLQHAARYLANQEWVKNDSLKTVENTAIPIIMLVVEVPGDLISSAAKDDLSLRTEHEISVHSDAVGSEESSSPKCSQINNESKKDVKLIRLDISFKSSSHTGLQTTELVKDLTEWFPAATPLALILKQFLADRSLDQSYSGGLSSYCLVLLITRFLQHEHHLGRPINQNWGSLLMDFLYFFGNVFDPRQMRISVQGSGVYINRERGYSIDPLHIDDPLFPTNNVGRNCFRIHQCIKAFSEAYTVLENELASLPDEADVCSRLPYRLLSKIIPSINLLMGT